jgi:hypothetical protein
MSFEHAIVFTGHVTDDPDRAEPRFPEAMCDLAIMAISGAVLEIAAASNKAVLVSSLARGADIIAVEVAKKIGLAVRLFLPQRIPVFKQHSPLKEWELKFNDILWEEWQQGPENVMIINGGTSGEDYAHANQEAVWWAKALAPKITLLAFWDGKDNNFAGGTSHFIATARSDGIDVKIIDAERLLSLHRSRT